MDQQLPTILVTGGAGYIGSHTTALLLAKGFAVVVVDNLTTGMAWAVDDAAHFYQLDVADQRAMANIMADHQVKAVIHFAGSTVVPESVSDPLKYYRNNVSASERLLASCQAQGVKHVLFSSSAAVYGMPDTLPVAEQAATVPINPYGRSKLITEWQLADLAAADDDFSYVALRYFNVAGASAQGNLGQATPNATHLIKVCCQVALGIRPVLDVYGSDYDTTDGTCIRDFIHVDDLAQAHLDALTYLLDGGASDVMNCGYGHGYSVQEVVAMVKQVSGVDFAVNQVPRRAGDPAAVVADNSRIRQKLAWQPRFNDLKIICQSAFEWEKKMFEAAQTTSGAKVSA